MALASELPIDTSATALEMANTIFGTGVTVETASYTGAAVASGVFTDGATVAPGATPADVGVILSTGRADDFTNSSGEANLVANRSTNHGLDGDEDLTAISGFQTFDAAVLEVSFTPAGDTLTMQLVFGSEEYLEFVNSGFNDAVGVFVNDVKAELTVGAGDISIDNINTTSNSNLFLDNPAGASIVNSEMDGLTITMTLKAPVVPGETNVIRIGIADAGDGVFDSNLLIAAGSVQTTLIAGDDTFSVERGGGILDVLANDIAAPGATLTITEINGEPVVAGDSVVLPTGEIVTLGEDGSLSITGVQGDIPNPFTYTVTDNFGNEDTAFVSVDSAAPCFEAAALIDTLRGPVRADELAIGDLVLTHDHGPQPVRWVGQTTRLARGSDAPVSIDAGALGDHGAVRVSQNHRIFVKALAASLVCGQEEVFVRAADLINGHSIRIEESAKQVTYVHILLDQHGILRSAGLLSESFHPGALNVDAFDGASRLQILRLMPNPGDEDGFGYGPTARPVLKKWEAQVVRQYLQNGTGQRVQNDLTVARAA
ncbi:MAG: choice-of-anchor L domain-containing protein [Pikeienuella sp.]